MIYIAIYLVIVVLGQVILSPFTFTEYMRPVWEWNWIYFGLNVLALMVMAWYWKNNA